MMHSQEPFNRPTGLRLMLPQALPQGRFWTFLDPPQKLGNPLDKRVSVL
jgi:hypothetical protein